MFKIAQSDRFTFPVPVEIVGDNGRRITQTFDATFKRLTQPEFKQLMQRAQANEIDDLAIAADVLLGWRGIQAEDGTDMPFSDENREKLLQIWPVLPAVVSAFIESHGPKAKAKN
jgi:hypothetical protein